MALSQTHYRFGVNELAESTHGWHAAEDTTASLPTGTTFLVRINAQETAASAHSNQVFTWQYRLNSGTWTNITTTSTVVMAVTPVCWANGANCTKRLSGTGTFETTAAGCTADGTAGGSANDIVANGCSETEIAVQIVYGDVSNGDTIEFRLSEMSAFAVTPSLTVVKVNRLYLRDAPAPEAPTNGAKSTAIPAGSGSVSGSNSGNPYENRSLLTVRGETLPESTIVTASPATTSEVRQYLMRCTSRKLGAQTFGSGTWTLALSLAEADLNANSFLNASLYVWRPSNSSVVGYIYDSATNLGAEWNTTQVIREYTLSGSNVTSQAGDVLVLEIWRHATQGAATAYNQTVIFNGYNDATGATADAGSYLLPPANFTFAAAYLPAPVSGVFVESCFYKGPIKDGNGALYTILEGTEGTPNPRFMKSTDGGKTWAQAGTATGPTTSNYRDLESLWAIQVGTKIIYLRQRSGTTAENVSYHEYNTSDAASNADSWTLSESVVGAVGTSISDQAVTLIRRSNGNLYAFYTHAVSANAQSFRHKIKPSGGAWGTEKYEAGGSVTGVQSTNIFTCTAHRFAAGDRVAFSGLTGGTGITAGTSYHVISANLTANTFQVSTTAGGAALDFTTDLTAGLVEKVGIAQVQCVLDPATSGTHLDKIHVFIKTDTTAAIGGTSEAVRHASLDSSDTWSSWEDCQDNAVITSETCMVHPPVAYLDGSDSKVYVAWGKGTGKLAGCFVTNDGTPDAEEEITDNFVWHDPPEVASHQPVAGLAVDAGAKKIYCVYSMTSSLVRSVAAPAAEADMYLAVRDSAGGWGTDTELLDGCELQLVSCNVFTHSAGNGGAKVLGIIYDDSNGPFYTEVVLTSGDVASSVPLVLTGSATLTAAGTLAGAAANVLTGTGLGQGAGVLTGLAESVLAGTGAIQGMVQLVGTSDSVLTATGTTLGAGSLAGAAPSVLTGSGTLLGAGSIAGTATLAFTEAGVLLGGAPIIGTSVNVLTATGTTLGTGTLVGTTPLVITAEGTTEVAGAQAGYYGFLGWFLGGFASPAPAGGMLGTAEILITGSAAVTATGSLAAAAPLLITVSAAPQGAGVVIGAASLLLSASGTVQGAGVLTAASALTLDGIASLSASGQQGATASLVVTASGATLGAGVLVGTTALVVTASGTLSAGGEFGANSALTVTGTAVLAATGGLSGSSIVTLTTVGSLTAIVQIAGTSPLVITGQGNLTGLAQGDLAGQAVLGFIASGTALAAGSLSGSATITLPAVATVQASGVLSGTSPLTMTVTATTQGGVVVSGSAGLFLSTTASPSAGGTLASVSDLLFTGAGSLSGIVAATSEAGLILAAQGSLNAGGVLSGSAALVFTTLAVPPSFVIPLRSRLGVDFEFRVSLVLDLPPRSVFESGS